MNAQEIFKVTMEAQALRYKKDTKGYIDSCINVAASNGSFEAVVTLPTSQYARRALYDLEQEGYKVVSEPELIPEEDLFLAMDENAPETSFQISWKHVKETL